MEEKSLISGSERVRHAFVLCGVGVDDDDQRAAA
jgi:hypothetical protein